MHLTCCIVLFFSAPVHVYYFEFLAVVDNRSFVVYVCLHVHVLYACSLKNFQKRNGQYIYYIFGYTFETVLIC